MTDSPIAGVYYIEQGVLHPLEGFEPEHRHIKTLAMDLSGNLWVGTSNGLHCFDPRLERIPLPHPRVQPTCILVDSHGVVWVGTYGAGLARYRDGDFEYFERLEGLAANQVLSLAETPDGSLWIGTADGLTQLSDVKFPTYSRSEGLVAGGSLAVAASPQGGVWVGTPDGVSLFRDGAFTNFGRGAASFGSFWIKRVYPMRNGDVYFFGAQKNIDLMRDGEIMGSWQFEQWPRAMVEDAHGVVVALGGALMRLDAEGNLSPYLLADATAASFDWINYLLVGRDGAL